MSLVPRRKLDDAQRAILRCVNDRQEDASFYAEQAEKAERNSDPFLASALCELSLEATHDARALLAEGFPGVKFDFGSNR